MYVEPLVVWYTEADTNGMKKCIPPMPAQVSPANVISVRRLGDECNGMAG